MLYNPFMTEREFLIYLDPETLKWIRKFRVENGHN